MTQILSRTLILMILYGTLSMPVLNISRCSTWSFTWARAMFIFSFLADVITLDYVVCYFGFYGFWYVVLLYWDRQKTLARVGASLAFPIWFVRFLSIIQAELPWVSKFRLLRHIRGLFVTLIRIGSEGYSPWMIVDTGGDDTWVQCEDCKTRFPILEGSFGYVHQWLLSKF